MKKILAILGPILVIFTVFCPRLALAEAATSVTQPYDWMQLGTVPGAIAATLLIVQYCKLPLDNVWKLPTRLVVLILAFGILVAAKAFTDGISQGDWILIGINTFVVALGAMGAYEVSFGKVNK